MGIVDKAKAAKRVLEERLTPHPVVFHHVPKCGGTSVGRALRQKYILSQATVTPEESFRAFEAFTGRTDREQMLIDVLDLREQMMLYHLFEGVRCVSLHVRFSNVAYETFKDTYKFITILREPVSRFISHYYWSHNKPHAHARIDEDFEAFLDTDRAKRLGASYVEYYGGLHKDADIRSPEAINAAIENLKKFDVVGRLDDLNGFKADLKAKLGASIKIGHENKGKRSVTANFGRVSEQHEQKIRDLCQPDMKVWNGFKKRSQKQAT